MCYLNYSDDTGQDLAWPGPDLARTGPGPDRTWPGPDLARTGPGQDLARTGPDLAWTGPDLARTGPGPGLCHLHNSDDTFMRILFISGVLFGLGT